MNRNTTSALALTALLGTSQLVATTVNAQTNRYNFDQIVKNTTDKSLNAQLFTIGDEASLALFRRDGNGLAMRFPPMGLDVATEGAVLIIPNKTVDEDDPDMEGEYDLDPESGKMEIQVNVRLHPDLLSNGIPKYDNAGKLIPGSVEGMNIVQKGAFMGVQWKLQIDNAGGHQRLGCRFSPAGNPLRRVAFPKFFVSGPSSEQDIFDNTWKTIRCKRDGDVVSVSVGNGYDEETSQDGLGSLESTADVNIGGLIQEENNGSITINDQFHGEMDNLIIRFGNDVD